MLSVVILTLALTALPAPVSRAGLNRSQVGYPDSIAAVGDSITRAFNSSTIGVDAPENSWSTGTSSDVKSQYTRLLGSYPAISGQNFNAAVSGAKMADLKTQVGNVVDKNA